MKRATSPCRPTVFSEFTAFIANPPPVDDTDVSPVRKFLMFSGDEADLLVLPSVDIIVLAFGYLCLQ